MRLICPSDEKWLVMLSHHEMTAVVNALTIAARVSAIGSRYRVEAAELLNKIETQLKTPTETTL